MLQIREDDLSDPAVQALLELHLAGMHAHSPPGAVFALGAAGLQGPEVTVFTAWEDGDLAGMGALKRFGPSLGEIKSMRTHPGHLRRGVAAALLQHIIAVARTSGVTRVSLETGRGPAFGPALQLYRTRGFLEGGPFADYRRSDFSQFFHLKL